MYRGDELEAGDEVDELYIEGRRDLSDDVLGEKET